MPARRQLKQRVHVIDTDSTELIMNIRKQTASGFLTIALLAVFTTALEADDMAYMLGKQEAPRIRLGLWTSSPARLP
jgi:hypothetical protein